MKPFVLIGVAVLFFVYRSAEATQVKPCTDDPAAKYPEGTDLDKMITIPGCPKLPCKVHRKSAINMEFRFTPTNDTKTLTNSVHGKILGVPFPFLGVDRTSACSQIFKADGTTRAGCPLKAGTEYVYKNKIDILEIYPAIKVLAHWALIADDGSKPVCFNAPVRILA